MTITEKVAYIKGLADGMKLDEGKNENKLLLAMLDVLKDMALTLEDYDETFDDMAEIVADLEEGLYELEDEVYSDEYDFSGHDDFDDLYEISCDKCGETVTVDYEVLESGTLTCPKCGEVQEFDFVIDDEDCDCGCGNDR